MNTLRSYKKLSVATGLRYAINLAARTREQEGWKAASVATGRLLVDETKKRGRRAALRQRSDCPVTQQHKELDVGVPLDGVVDDHVLMSPEIVTRLVDDLERLPGGLTPVRLDPDEFAGHIRSFRYPRFYAGGSVATGGHREKKMLEYFACLKLMPINSSDVVIDIASERSVFPDVIRRLAGATVYRQDLIYASGLNGERIGGNAADMPVREGFATKLTLHNSFEHFEGDADAAFVREAWRVLRPGGAMCILPVFLTDQHSILTDPLVDRTDVQWDSDARVISLVGHRNRFSRFYSPSTLEARVLRPARDCGFRTTMFHLENLHTVEPGSQMHFALVFEKPS